MTMAQFKGAKKRNLKYQKVMKYNHQIVFVMKYL